MRRTIAAAAFVLSSIALFSTTAHAKRVALIIGNNAYENVGPLEKAVNDARAMDKALAAIGFATIRAENTTHRQMNLKLLEFASQLEQGDEALFFFAGHGVEIDGRNYLLPTDVPDAAPGQDELIKSLSVGSDVVLDYIRRKGVRVSILILDACRNNPFKRAGTRSLGGTRGLAQARAPEGTFIMYSAGVGQLALDTLGEGDSHPNSVFTRSLIPLLKEPGLSLPQTARKVRRQVQKLAKRVSHSQRPAYYDEVTGDFRFIASETGQPRSSSHTDSPNFIANEEQTQRSAAERQWSSLKGTASCAVLEIFLENHGSSEFAQYANARKAELKCHLKVASIPKVEQPVHVEAIPVGRPLAFQLQRQLNRHGCSAGEPDGVWGGQSRKAASAFQIATGLKSGTEPSAALLQDLKSALSPACSDPSQSTVQMGKSLKDCPACPEMILVPAGQFLMGSDSNEPERGNDEAPQHNVKISRQLAVGKFEITMKEWFACVANGGCKHQPSENYRDRAPVVSVSFADARSYTDWLSRVTGKKYRLPSESEWEYFARASTKTSYHFGDQIACTDAYFAHGGFHDNCMGKNLTNIGYGGPADVGMHAPNAFGLHDVHGNVSEWTADCYKANYVGKPRNGSAALNSPGKRYCDNMGQKVYRGGAWNDGAKRLRSARRFHAGEHDRSYNRGFRVVRE